MSISLPSLPAPRAAIRRATLFAALLVTGLPSLVGAQSVVLSQQSFILDGVSTPTTEWGAADLTYTGQSPILYFNLAVNGSWQVQNVPVLSANGTGVTQSEVFSFDLGVPRGTNAGPVSYGYTLTSSVQGTMPVSSLLSSTAQTTAIFNSGVSGTPVPPVPPAAPLLGGPAADPVKHTVMNFPNQEAAKNECAPAAASNSLQYLNSKYQLNLKPGDISIAAFDTAMNFDPAKGVSLAGWPELKNAYLKSKGIGVSTTKFTTFADIIKEVDAGEDVELQGDWHTAAVVGITDLGGGKYALDVAHDTMQGVAGGTRVDSIVYDPTTGKFKGSPSFFDGSSFQYAVGESPVPEASTFAGLSFGLLILGTALWRARKRVSCTA